MMPFRHPVKLNVTSQQSSGEPISYFERDLASFKADNDILSEDIIEGFSPPEGVDYYDRVSRSSLSDFNRLYVAQKALGYSVHFIDNATLFYDEGSQDEVTIYVDPKEIDQTLRISNTYIHDHGTAFRAILGNKKFPPELRNTEYAYQMLNDLYTSLNSDYLAFDPFDPSYKDSVSNFIEFGMGREEAEAMLPKAFMNALLWDVIEQPGRKESESKKIGLYEEFSELGIKPFTFTELDEMTGKYLRRMIQKNPKLAPQISREHSQSNTLKRIIERLGSILRFTTETSFPHHPRKMG